MRIHLSNLFWLVLIVAISVGWWKGHQGRVAQIETLQQAMRAANRRTAINVWDSIPGQARVRAPSP